MTVIIDSHFGQLVIVSLVAKDIISVNALYFFQHHAKILHYKPNSDIFLSIQFALL